MGYGLLLVLLGVTLTFGGLGKGGWWLLAVWLGCNFLVLGVAHLRGAHRVFGKRPNGTLPIWSWCFYLPFLIYSWLIWRALRLCREPAQSKVSEHLAIGRRLLPFELAHEFENFVDLTAEFQEPSACRRQPSYISFPILDGAAPSPEMLRTAIANLRPGRTFIHCAQGHGRTGLFALALLLASKKAETVDIGLRMLQAVRPRVHLNRAQRKCIAAFAKGLARGCEAE